MPDFDLSAVFLAPRITTTGDGRHLDTDGQEYAAVEVDGELTFRAG